MTRDGRRIRYMAGRFLAVVCLCGILSAGAGQAADPKALTNIPGDATRGRALLRDMSRASCLICHRISQLDEKDQGEIGPALDGIASRLDAAQLRQRIVDPRRLNSDTIMPPYFALDNLFEVAAAYRGKTIYSAQEIEDVVSYLLTLTGELDK